MQQEVFGILANARSLEDLGRIEPKARQVYRRYMDELDDADVKELAIHKRVSKLNYSRRCAEASAVQVHIKQGIPLVPGMEIGYLIRDARKGRWNPENSIKVRCCILSRSAGEGLVKVGYSIGLNNCPKSCA